MNSRSVFPFSTSPRLSAFPRTPLLFPEYNSVSKTIILVFKFQNKLHHHTPLHLLPPKGRTLIFHFLLQFINHFLLLAQNKTVRKAKPKQQSSPRGEKQIHTELRTETLQKTPNRDHCSNWAVAPTRQAAPLPCNKPSFFSEAVGPLPRSV